MLLSCTNAAPTDILLNGKGGSRRTKKLSLTKYWSRVESFHAFAEEKQILEANDVHFTMRKLEMNTLLV